MKYLLKKILYIFYSKQDVDLLGPSNLVRYFLFQKIFRINSHVPWPVHWGSIVTAPGMIERKSLRPFPGYMPGQYIQAMNGIKFGANVRIGPGVKIISANHDIYNFEKHVDSGPIIIGDNCWLGANSVILPGVSIASHVIVAAGAVVSKSVTETNCIIAGVPAVIVKHISAYNTECQKSSKNES